jgi:phosphotransferase system enzyme I (PtsI)
MAMGTAAVVRVRSGIPMLPDVPARIAQLVATHRLTERPEVILVAEDYRTGLMLAGALTWAKVVGIATEIAEPGAPVTSVPAVVGVQDLLSVIEDEMLLLVDAERGVVLADPDPMAIAQYQAEHDHIAPRHRIYLEGVHLAAQTLDGRTLQVVARVTSEEELTEALDDGADALYVPFNAPLLPVKTEPGGQRRHLLDLTQSSAGKPLLLADDYALPSRALVEAAAHAEITLAVPPREELAGLGLAELATELQAAETECFEEEIAGSLPRLAANMVALPEEETPEQIAARLEKLSACGAARLLLSLEGVSLDEAILPQLETLIATAQANLLPVTAMAYRHSFNPFGTGDLENTLETAISFLVGMDVVGVIVGPGQVTEAKTIIRNLSASERREALLDYLGG